MNRSPRVAAMRILFLILAVLAAAPGFATVMAAEPQSVAPPAAHLRDILQREPYQRWKLRQERAARPDTDSGMGGEFWTSVREYAITIGDWIRSVWKWLFDGKESGPGFFGELGGMFAFMRLAGWVVLAALLSGLTILALRMARNRGQGRGTARVLSREQVGAALESGEALALDVPQWLAEAERLAREGNFRAVYRALYLALLSGLHESGGIDFRRNRTNWAYVDSFRGGESERRVFAELTGLFDEVWYGRRSAANRDIGALRRKVGRILERGRTG